MGITDLIRRIATTTSPASTDADDAARKPRTQRMRRAGGQTRSEIRTSRRARIRDLRGKVELVNLKRVLAYHRACGKADRAGIPRPAYPELLTIDSVRPPAPVPQTNRDPSDGSLMPMVAAALASGVARMVADASTRKVDGSTHARPGGDPPQAV